MLTCLLAEIGTSLNKTLHMELTVIKIFRFGIFVIVFEDYNYSKINLIFLK